MSAQPELRLVEPLPAGIVWPDGTGELLSVSDATHRIRDLLDERDGLIATTQRQAREIGRLQRRIAEDEDPDSHPQGAEIVALIDRWKAGSGHHKARTSADRIKLVKARIKDGYAVTSDDPLPTEATLELAVDGICAFPYVVNGHRQNHGSPAQRHDRLGIALEGGEAVEKFARLGYAARRAGWRPEATS